MGFESNSQQNSGRTVNGKALCGTTFPLPLQTEVMKPQQQDTAAKSESAVYVQTPEGGTINVPTDHSLGDAGADEKSSSQVAENTPTKASEEVTSGD